MIVNRWPHRRIYISKEVKIFKNTHTDEFRVQLSLALPKKLDTSPIIRFMLKSPLLNFLHALVEILKSLAAAFSCVAQ